MPLSPLSKAIFKLSAQQMNEFINSKETSMLTSDYRRGVEDATTPLVGQFIFVQAAFNEEMTKRRKALLTKKVTKYVIIRQSLTGTPTAATVYDTEDQAIEDQKIRDGSQELRDVFGLEKDAFAALCKPTPVEIEIPL